MSYFCSDDTFTSIDARNADKIRMVCDLMNASKYRTIAQNFLRQKDFSLECRYSYSVSDPATQKPAAHVFFASDKVQYGYYIKVSRITDAVSEWYRNEDISETRYPKWVALDLVSNEPVEYYTYKEVGGYDIEKKFNSVTHEELAVNHFQKFYEMTPEQQELIKDLPFKRTSVCWSNKPAGFTVEFLPSYVDVYQGINMANLPLLGVGDLPKPADNPLNQ
jgi:hypothetical protein